MEEVKEETKTRVPYAKRLEATLETQKEMQACLEARLQMLDATIEEYNKTTEGYYKSSETTQVGSVNIPSEAQRYEINEARILCIKTKGELDVLKRVIHEKQTYFDNFVQQHEKDWEEVQKRWDITIKIAKTSINPGVKKLMDNIRWDVIEADEEVKIGVYKALKKYI